MTRAGRVGTVVLRLEAWTRSPDTGARALLVGLSTYVTLRVDRNPENGTGRDAPYVTFARKIDVSAQTTRHAVVKPSGLKSKV
jgi:hypothetical protein